MSSPHIPAPVLMPNLSSIVCPNCQHEFSLSETLAAEVQSQVDQQVQAQVDAQVQAQLESQLSQERVRLRLDSERQLEALRAEQTRQTQLALEAKASAERSAAKTKLEAEAQLRSRTAQLAELQSELERNHSKLAEAQAAQAALIGKQRELDDAKRELELTIAKRVEGSLAEIRDKARKEADEAARLRVAEKDMTIASMQSTIEELKRKSQQGSQQLQGEVHELELENTLRSKFPRDSIEPVAKGEFGGDILQRVYSASAQAAGTILWEAKRTKNWSDAWLAKLRDDQRSAKADIAVLVSHALPKITGTPLASFDLVDGVWVVGEPYALAVATMLRQGLLEVSLARTLSAGQESKAELVYQYLTGSQFRQRIEAIVEAFTTMQDDLAAEKKAIGRQWAKREAQIERVMNSTVGMYGDLQGIAGKSLQEIDGLGLAQLGLDSD